MDFQIKIELRILELRVLRKFSANFCTKISFCFNPIINITTKMLVGFLGFYGLNDF